MEKIASKVYSEKTSKFVCFEGILEKTSKIVCFKGSNLRQGLAITGISHSFPYISLSLPGAGDETETDDTSLMTQHPKYHGIRPIFPWTGLG